MLKLNFKIYKKIILIYYYQKLKKKKTLLRYPQLCKQVA
jgi:hypothetical protein